MPCTEITWPKSQCKESFLRCIKLSSGASWACLWAERVAGATGFPAMQHHLSMGSTGMCELHSQLCWAGGMAWSPFSWEMLARSSATGSWNPSWSQSSQYCCFIFCSKHIAKHMEKCLPWTRFSNISAFAGGPRFFWSSAQTPSSNKCSDYPKVWPYCVYGQAIRGTQHTTHHPPWGIQNENNFLRMAPWRRQK